MSSSELCLFDMMYGIKTNVQNRKREEVFGVLAFTDMYVCVSLWLQICMYFLCLLLQIMWLEKCLLYLVLSVFVLICFSCH